MSDLDKLFENAPEGATAIGQRGNDLAFTNGDSDAFLDGHWGISMGWKTIATRPQPELAQKAPETSGFDFDAVRERELKIIRGIPEELTKNANQPRKTVEDVVASNPDGWNSLINPYPCSKPEGKQLVLYSLDSKEFHKGCEGFDARGYQEVCTREQFEACVAAKDKSEPKWTHISTGGNKCRYLMETVHGDLYENEWGTKFIPGFEGCNSVEPIKPKITKAEHEFLCKFSADVNDIHVVNSVESYLAKHEVVE